jgi:hypothetical protein
MFKFQVIAKTDDGDLIVAQFIFKSDAQAFVRAMDMPRGYHRVEPIAKG